MASAESAVRSTWESESFLADICRAIAAHRNLAELFDVLAESLRGAERMKKPITTILSDAMDALVQYEWPGNIRELQNFIERAVILSSGTVLRPSLTELRNSAKVSVTQNGPSGSRSLEEAEREYIVGMLKETAWVLGGIQGAAAKLGIPRTTLLYKMRRLGIPRQQA